MQRDAQLPNGGATFGGLAHDAAAGANLALTMLDPAAQCAHLRVAAGAYAAKAAGVAVTGLAFPTVDEGCANAIAKWWCSTCRPRPSSTPISAVSRNRRPNLYYGDQRR